MSDPAGYLFEMRYPGDRWSGTMFAESISELNAEDVRNVRPLYLPVAWRWRWGKLGSNTAWHLSVEKPGPFAEEGYEVEPLFIQPSEAGESSNTTTQDEVLTDEAIWGLTGDIIGLQQRLLNCENLDDFMALRHEIRTKWDADVADGRRIWEEALAKAKLKSAEGSKL